MSSESADIRDFFKEYVFGFMFHNIETAISAKASFLAALGLLECTEIMGGLVTGNLQDRSKARENFDAFVPYLGRDYGELKTKLKPRKKGEPGCLYDRMRCGLAHGYFTKGAKKTIYMTHHMTRHKKPEACGIAYTEEDDHIELVVVKYFCDFRKAVENYRSQLISEKNTNLLNTFRKARQGSL
jgi:hypothetical protein